MKAKTDIEPIPGQMNIFSYMDQIGMLDKQVMQIRKDTTASLYCFTMDVNISSVRDFPTGMQTLYEDEFFYTVSKSSDATADNNLNVILSIPKSRANSEETIKIFVLCENTSGLQIAEYCFGGRFQEVAAVNRLLQKLGALPSQIVITHITKHFHPVVFSRAFKHCGIKVDSVESKDIPDLARMLKRSLSVAKDVSFADISTCENKINNDPKLTGESPEYSWTVRKKYLKPLPEPLYSHTEHQKADPLFNYHVKVNNHYYSIPKEICEEYRSTKKKLNITVTACFVEISDEQGVICCVHNNDEDSVYPYTTDCTHMPNPSEVPYKNYNGIRFLCWANHLGRHVSSLVTFYLRYGSCEMQGYMSCLSLLSLSKGYTAFLDQACSQVMQSAHDLKLYPSPSWVKDICKKLSQGAQINPGP